MLTQRSLKRLLVLSTVEDIGFLLLGVASLNALGIKGVVFAASTHALAKALLFACLAGPEADGELDGELSYIYATAFANVARTLTAEQKAKLAALRNANPSDPKGPFLYSSPISMPQIEITDFLFIRQ